MASIINQFFVFSSILYLSLFTNLLFAATNPGDIISKQVAALLDLKGNLRNTIALDSSWKKGTDPCKSNWYGVICDSHKGVIVDLRLQGLGLSGDFTAESLKALDHIRLINIANNNFTGPIPDFWILGKSLNILSINNNKFDDFITNEAFANMTNLRRIDISGNEFDGTIPETLTSLKRLRNLNMSNNGFSGPVPVFRQETLKWLDLSNNKLEGEIPEEMLRFDKKVFAGNPRLCSAKQGKECNGESLPGGNGKKSYESKGESWIVKWIVLAVVVGFILLTLLLTNKKERNEKRNSLKMRFKKSDDEVHLDMGKAAGMTNRMGSLGSRKSSRKLRMAELVIVNEERGVFGMQDVMNASAEVLGNGEAGSAYKVKMADGLSVVVKRLKTMNKLGKEDFDRKMRMLGGLRHKNILPPLAYHYRKGERLIVSEYVKRGSLLYVLHGNGKSHAKLSWPIRLKIIKGVAQGLRFLHSQSQFSVNGLPHGNLKSSNILLSQDFEPLLNDYSLSPMVDDLFLAQTMFAYKTPEALFSGKVSPKSDVFCLGIVILEVLTGRYPAQYLNNQSGGTDVVQWSRSAVSKGKEMELIDQEIVVSGMEGSFVEMEKLLQVGVACTQDDHDSRLGIEEAVKRIEEI